MFVLTSLARPGRRLVPLLVVGLLLTGPAGGVPNAQASGVGLAVRHAGQPPRIHDIQGVGHISTLDGTSVSNVPGIVTAKRSNGFYMQDPSPDSDERTSDGMFVFTSSAPSSVSVGDSVLVGGTVTEFRSGGTTSTNLTTTQINSPAIVKVSSGNALPAPIVIGIGGRIPPQQVIEDDARGSVETSGVFDPASDGIDFYESLEGMLVQINNAVVVGARSSFGEIPVLSDNGANAGLRTARGGIVVRPTDFNPERIILDDEILATPSANVGDRFPLVVGVLDYSFGNFKLEITQSLTVTSGGLTREITSPPGGQQLAVATFNVQNLSPADGPDKFNTLAGHIVNSLKSPDLLALEEIQDNNGPVDNGVVDATVTFNTLISAIQGAGGPTYQFRSINPFNNQDGGQPGGNIRVGFLVRTDRGLAFIDRPGGGSTIATSVLSGPGGPQLSSSPGRLDPNNAAFNASRKPLAGELTFLNQKLFVVANHFNSKTGDQPLFGRFQPPARSTEVQRAQQAQVVNDFVKSILALDADANIIVLGDLNDFEFSNTQSILKSGGVLNDLVDTLPQDDRYTFIFEGNSQVLDHILVSSQLLKTRIEYDIVHLNSEFAVQSSDHEPQVARLTFGIASVQVVEQFEPQERHRRRLTEEQRQQRLRTDRSSLDDTRAEGNVVAVQCDEGVPVVLIANRDGLQTVQLLYKSRQACASIRVGDYLSGDGEKQHEFLFEAHDVTIERGGSRVR